MSAKLLPSENEILTRTGKIVNPLNIQTGDISILDVVHCLPIFPMLGGQTRKFYSMAEHSNNMYDYLDMYLPELIEKFDRKAKDDEEIEFACIADIKKRHLRLFTLLYLSPYPFLSHIAGCFKSWNYHYPRVLASIVQDVGLDYDEYKLCAKMLQQVDKEVRSSVYTSFNVINDRWLFMQPQKAQEEYICRFNKDSDMELKTTGSGIYIAEPVESAGQFYFDFSLPTLRL